MTSTLSDAYPGTAACAADLVALADAYRRAAGMLLNERQPFSRAPGALCAIHAIELYLSAFLMHRGTAARQIRGYGHDLALRGTLVTRHGLVLRGRTMEHLIKMTQQREYLVSRYGPETIPALSQTNRIEATMNEIAAKVTGAVNRPASVPARSSVPGMAAPECSKLPLRS